MEKINLRDGWRAEQWGPESYKGLFIALCYKRLGTVTLDFEKRVFRAGWSTVGPSSKPDGLIGRGWKQKLADAAMQWMEGVFNPQAEECPYPHKEWSQ